MNKTKQLPESKKITVKLPPKERKLRDGDIILLEGNYLLLDTDGWNDLSSFADYTISLTADESLLRKRLIERRIACGHPKEESANFVDFSDIANVRLCLEHSKKADLMLRVNENGEIIPRQNTGASRVSSI